MDPLITFDYRDDGGRPRFELEGVGGINDWPDEDRVISCVNMGDMIRQYQYSLTSLRLRIQGDLSWRSQERVVGSYLTQLYRSGRKVWTSLLGRNSGPWLARLNDALTSHLKPSWWLDPLARAHLCEVQVKGPDSVLLPLDVLPLGIPDKALIADLDDLLSYVSIFGGFVSRVRYRATFAGQHMHPTMTGPRATRYFRSSKAPGVNLMDGLLRNLKERVLGPYPSEEDYDDAYAIALSLLLAEPSRTEQLTPDLVEVYSHGFSFDDPVRQLVLQLDYANGSCVIDGDAFGWAQDRVLSKGVVSGPIVLLNACHSLGGLGCETFSDALRMAQAGSRVVMGVRDELPAEVALHFTRYLLQGLRDDKGVGQAVLDARWGLMKDYANPLGLLYASFGDINTTRSI
jgi:hypothetical protein